MGIHVNRNLALETLSAVALPEQAEAAERDVRAELAAQFIPAGARVLELGGNAALRSLVPHGCIYNACALADEFPTKAAADADIIVMLGALETVADAESLFTHLRFCKRDVVLSYHPTDFGQRKNQTRDRASQGFVNHFSLYELTLLFDRYGFRIECTAPVDECQMLIRLTPAERLKAVAPCSVAVISGNDAGNLGERLGYHMINALLPGEAEVHHLTFCTLAQARDRYDLVVLGAGNSLFQPLIDDEVLDVVSRAKAAIGIFGTQYRELIPRASLDRLLDRLDTWFARYEDDVLLYGRGRKNVVHLGDWLIDQFPLNRPSLDDPLQIDDEIAGELALDRAIQVIQQHRQVYSSRLAPLLCALTSAELAAYAEQPAADMPGIVSGKFRSMLIDIFGRSYAEKKFFMVDRDAVARYKARVHRNVAQVGERIDAILRNVAVAAV
jgi:Methyltransferase domain